MIGTINITLSVSFEYDNNCHSFEEAAGIATSLAVRPVYGTAEEGIELIDHEVIGVEDEYNQCQIEIS